MLSTLLPFSCAIMLVITHPSKSVLLHQIRCIMVPTCVSMNIVHVCAAAVPLLLDGALNLFEGCGSSDVFISF